MTQTLDGEGQNSDLEDETNVTWTDFTQKTTFHGVKYIFSSDANIKFRRPLWGIVVVFSVVFFLLEVGIRTRAYWEYETSIGVAVNYKESIEFPAITICNQNTYRITATVDSGLYNLIDEVYQTSNATEIDWGRFATEITQTDVKQFALSTGHQKLLFIDGCTWNGDDCNIASDFETVITDLGVCYTFNGGSNKTQGIQTKQSGAGSGLQLVINVEQYEYMRGPQNDAGIKVLLHPRDEVPMMKDQGFAAAPGTHTFVAMKRYETDWLEPPYGNCVPENPPISQCLHICKAHHVIKECGCHAVYMKEIDNNSTKQCDLKLSLSCIQESVEQKKSEDCACIKPPCHLVRFHPKLSYAQLSTFNIDQMILDKPEKQQSLQTIFLMAREVEQRHKKEIVAKDEQYMTSGLEIGHSFYMTIRNSINASFTLSNGLVDKELMDADMIKIFDEAFSHLTESKLIVYPMTNFRDNITSIQTDFLECNGNRSLFYENMMVCVEQSNVDGSGDLASELDMVMICMDETGRKDRIDDMKEYYDKTPFNETFDHFQNSLKYYLEIVDNYYNNKTPLAYIPAHAACQLVLSSEHQLTILDEEINLYGQKLVGAETMKQLVNATKAMADIGCGDVLQAATRSLTSCAWLTAEMWRHFTASYIAFTKASESNARFLDLKLEMQATLVAMAKRYDEYIRPIMWSISAYLKGNITKAALAEYMESSQAEKGLKTLGSFYTDSYNAIKAVQNLLYPFQERVTALYQAMNEHSFINANDLNLIHLTLATNRTDFKQYIEGLETEIYTNLQMIINLIFTDLNLNLKEIMDTVPARSESVSKSLSIIQKELSQYTETIQMDVGFFMENFLQVDIFYKDMSYESRIQQATFGIASLLGEVGGFMGLLLGASIMTVCELIDYIIMSIIGTCRRQQAKSSSSNLKV